MARIVPQYVVRDLWPLSSKLQAQTHKRGTARAKREVTLVYNVTLDTTNFGIFFLFIEIKTCLYTHLETRCNAGYKKYMNAMR